MKPDSSASSTHVLGKEDAAILGRMAANAMRVLRFPCLTCGSVVKQTQKFAWGLVVLIDETGLPIPNRMYVTLFTYLKYKKQAIYESKGPTDRVSIFVNYST